MDKYLKQNKALWNEITPIHEKSTFYNVDNFKAGKCTLLPLELEEMGDVMGKTILHLQCHFGLDTLSWGRRGAKVTGVDFSDEAIKLAYKLSQETGIKAEFICADIYDLPKTLDKKFDVVFTSYGVLAWMPDLNQWGEIIAHFLKPGGFFYIAEIHPISYVIGEKPDKELKIVDQYFAKNEPERYEGGGDYASSFTHNIASYEWRYPLSKVVTALSRAGLRIEYLHEFPFCCYRGRPDMYQDKQGWWRLEGDKIPLTFSIKATKP